MALKKTFPEKDRSWHTFCIYSERVSLIKKMRWYWGCYYLLVLFLGCLSLVISAPTLLYIAFILAAPFIIWVLYLIYSLFSDFYFFKKTGQIRPAFSSEIPDHEMHESKQTKLNLLPESFELNHEKDERKVTCPKCHGQGYIDIAPPGVIYGPHKQCPRCKGSGDIFIE